MYLKASKQKRIYGKTYFYVKLSRLRICMMVQKDEKRLIETKQSRGDKIIQF